MALRTEVVLTGLHPGQPSYGAGLERGPGHAVRACDRWRRCDRRPLAPAAGVGREPLTRNRVHRLASSLVAKREVHTVRRPRDWVGRRGRWGARGGRIVGGT